MYMEIANHGTLLNALLRFILTCDLLSPVPMPLGRLDNIFRFMNCADASDFTFEG